MLKPSLVFLLCLGQTLLPFSLLTLSTIQIRCFSTIISFSLVSSFSRRSHTKVSRVERLCSSLSMDPFVVICPTAIILVGLTIFISESRETAIGHWVKKTNYKNHVWLSFSRTVILLSWSSPVMRGFATNLILPQQVHLKSSGVSR